MHTYTLAVSTSHTGCSSKQNTADTALVFLYQREQLARGTNDLGLRLHFVVQHHRDAHVHHVLSQQLAAKELANEADVA